MGQSVAGVVVVVPFSLVMRSSCVLALLAVVALVEAVVDDDDIKNMYENPLSRG